MAHIFTENEKKEIDKLTISELWKHIKIEYRKEMLKVKYPLLDLDNASNHSLPGYLQARQYYMKSDQGYINELNRINEFLSKKESMPKLKNWFKSTYSNDTKKKYIEFCKLKATETRSFYKDALIKTETEGCYGQDNGLFVSKYVKEMVPSDDELLKRVL